MMSELIPVVLVFDQVAVDSHINFAFTTAGVAWSLGATSGDSMGFTVTPAAPAGQPLAPLQQIEFSDTMLAMRTASNGANFSAFTVTLFLRVNSGTAMLQGYCTINREATVMAYFGAQSPMQWRSGRISAALYHPDRTTRSLRVSVQGAAPGNRIRLALSTSQEADFLATWSLGPAQCGSDGVVLAAVQGALPLTFLRYGSRTLEFEIGAGANATNEFFLQAYVNWHPAGLPYIYLKAECDHNVSLYAKIGSRQPQLVSQTYTVFTL
ncbi:hypothetical protein ACO0LM_01545 [Undibacterium sp. Di26W]|uniref:hypothetical protein n=1 Tax=Undibacterium sp. Di26W TaxID=3413035 RepID=UPI003BF0B801